MSSYLKGIDNQSKNISGSYNHNISNSSTNYHNNKFISGGGNSSRNHGLMGPTNTKKTRMTTVGAAHDHELINSK